MRHILLFEELTGRYKEETEILYRDKNLVCLIPKSQMTSNIYGQKTNWCSIRNQGFNMWTFPGKRSNIGRGLLIRFLFKDGYKLRLTYVLGNELVGSSSYHGEFNWSDKSGNHYFTFYFGKRSIKKDPFTNLESKYNETDVSKEINRRISLIPEECREKLRAIFKEGKGIEYKYSDKEYKAEKIKSKDIEYNKIVNFYRYDMTNSIEELHHVSNRFYIGTKYNGEYFKLEYSDEYGTNGNYLTKQEKFKNIKDFEKRLKEVLSEYWEKYREDIINKP